MRRIKTNSIGARVLSGFLSLLMVVSACPVSALADGNVDNTPVETTTTTIVVDETGVHTDGEDNNSYTIIVEDESNDENNDSLPADDDTEDQNTQDVDNPPNIDDGSNSGTADDEETVIVIDQDEENSDEDSDEDAEPTEETETEDQTEEAEEETAEPVYEYSVTLPDNKTVSEGDTLDIEAGVVAKVTVDDETSDVDYTFEFSGEGVEITTTTATGAAITFNNAGEYTIVGKLIVEGEEVASDEMTVKVNPVVVFDHYFTEIDESLVETSDLLVKTDDSSVFTKNTNVVSNFDDVYIIECASVEEARYVYSYYVDKVDSISDLSKVISIATDENNEDVADLDDLNDGNDVLAQLNDTVEDTKDIDYSDYIALIDTGANADVNFSVVGDDTGDSNGHGSRMLELIKNENPDAKVMSIRVFDGSTTDAASVYAGIKLAIANNVKIINLSLVGSDVEKNAIVKEVIQEAIVRGIVVIGAAGNYNLPANKFIPGCIESAIIIGAANEDGTKRANSNYNVDYYVIADSTSEATAIFTGLYSAGITESSKLFSSDFQPTIIEEPVEPEERDLSDLDGNLFIKAFIEETGYDYVIDADGNVSIYVPEVDYDEHELDGFVPQGTATGIETTRDIVDTMSAGSTFTGTCAFSESKPGYGTATITGNGNTFEQLFNGKTIDVDCEGHGANSTQSKYATCLVGPTVNYQATVSSIADTSDGSKRIVNFNVLFSNDGFGARTWTSHTDTWKLTTTYTYKTRHQLANGSWTDWTNETGGLSPDGKTSNQIFVTVDWTLTKSTDGTVKATYTGKSNKTETFTTSTNEVSSYIDGAKQDAYRNAAAKASENIVTVTDYGGIRNASALTGTINVNGLTQTYETTNQRQVYKGSADAWCWNYVYMSITKNTTYTGLITGSYHIDGTEIVATYADGRQVYDISGNPVIFYPTYSGQSQEYTLWYTDAYDKYITCTETKVGFGFQYRTLSERTDTHKVNSYNINNPTSFNITNIPMFDPPYLGVRKVSDTTGTPDFNADIYAVNAIYEINYYNIDTNGNPTGDVVRSWRMKTDNDGVCYYNNIGGKYFVDGNPFYVPGQTTILAWPIGYYTIREVVVPRNGNQDTGLYLSDKTYTAKVLPDGVSPDTSGSYSTANYTNAWMWDGDIEIWRRQEKQSIPNTNYNIDGRIAVNDVFFDQKEVESWRPLGILKADLDMDQLGYADSVLKVPEGSGAYDGAVYQVFSTSTKSNAELFNVTYHNPNGDGNILTLGSSPYSINATDGLGRDVSYSVNAKPVLCNGKPIYITISNGYGDTGNITFPFDDNYVLYEVTAPTGYAVNTYGYTISEKDWLDGNTADHLMLNDYNGTDHDVVKVSETSNRDGAVDDAIYRYGFAMWKKDLTNSNDTLGNTQGSGSLDGIRYAVINRSNHHVVMRNNYNVVDGSYCAIKDGVEIGTDRICAIVTTHTVDGVQGCLRMYGLPYGKYDVVELKIDAGTDDALIGAAFTDQGSSDMANPSYLRTDDTVYSFDYTTEDNKQYYGAGNIDHFTYAYAGQDGDHIYQDKIMVDGFQAYKLDEEYLEVTEGNSSANDIKFAVINRSTRTMEILQSDIDQLGLIDPNWASYVEFIPGGNTAYGVGNTDGQIAPGEVVAVITTHNGPEAVKEGTYAGQQVDGYFAIYGLPYGTYEVVELKRDANIHPGDVWETADKGNSIYANDSFYWNDTHFTYNLTDYNSHAHSVNGAFDVHKDLYSTGTSRYKDDVFRDGFSFWKRDLVYCYAPNEDGFLDHPQGDSTWNDIRYVVINKSDDNVKMFDKYTQQMPAADQPYVEIKNDVAIAPNCVVAIITSHQKSGNDDDELVKGYEQGYVALWGLPYGQYEIRELRADATIQVGDNYYESTKLGSSVFANYRVNSDLIGLRTDIANNPSMLYRDDIYFYYTLEDTKAEDGSDLHTGYTNNGRLIMMGNLHEVDDNNENTWDNETVYGNIIITKQDDETKIPDYNQGANSLAHVQFAVVNRSYWSVCYPYTEDLENAEDRYFEPDEVIAVLETDDTGTCRIDHLPYGTYEVYELRINDSYNTQQRTINLPNNSGQLVEVTCYGNTIKPHFVWNDAAMEAYKDWQKDYAAHKATTAVNGVAGQEGQYFGTDDRANEWYTWNEYINKYFVVQPEWRHEIGSGYDVHTEDDRTIRGYVGTTTNKQTGSTYEPQEYHFTWSDLPVRGDFKMQKANIDGDFMHYVPWLISLVESDANGDPIQNEDGSYNVIEEHVFVLDFDAMFDSRNWDARPKTVDNLNKYDDYVEFDPDLNKLVWTGSKEDLKAAATGNIWFGDIELENPNSKYVIKERGALLAGTYVIQEIPRVSKYGYPKFNDPGVNPEDAIEEVNLGNGKVRTIIWNTEDYDMISSTLRVVHDNPNPVLLPDDLDIGVDDPLTIQSEALDAIDETNSTIPSDHGLLRDTVTFGGLNTSQRYGYKTYIWRCDEDGNPIELLQETDMCTLDFTGSKYTNPTNNRKYNTLRNADPNFTSVVSGTFTDDTGSYTIIDNNYVVFRDHDGNFTRESAPNNDPTNDRFNVLYNLSIIQDFNVDTSMCQEGEKIAFAVDLYKSMGASGWSLVKQHNAELNEKTQYVGIIKFVTESTDKTTRTRVAGLGRYAYGEKGMPLVNNVATSGQLVYNADGEIVGYTLVDDKIVYSNLGDKQNYSFRAELIGVNSAGETFVVKDIYGNECKTRVSIYIDKDLDHVLHGTDIIDENGTPDDESDDVLVQGSLEGPCDGEFTFSDLGMMDWVIPNNPEDTISVFVRVELYNKRNICLKHHNYDLDEEDENIRWLQIKTTAMSEAGDEGVLPNGRSWDLDGNMIKGDVVLRDRIDYSNLAESVDIRVEGYVYLVGYDEEGKRFIDTNNGLDTPYVAYSSKNFTLTDVPEGSVEMQYTVKDSGQYAKRELVVCERVYMDLPGHAGVHADGKYVPENASMDSRSMIYICTDPNCGERFNTYGKATIHQQATGHHFVQEIAYGTLYVSKYVLHDDGDTEVLIALHEDINDEKQTVSIPEIETHLVNKHEGTEYKVVNRQYADVTVYDTVTYRNLIVGKPWTFTAELMDQETKLPVLDAEGNPVVAVKTFTPTAGNSTIDPVTGRAYGTCEVPITFKQVLTALDWESDPSWVCFESLSFGDEGHTDFKYAVHNNIYDERQTVHLPTFRTTVTSTVADPANTAAVSANDRQIQAAPNQTVTDTVEIKNVGLDTVIKSDLENTDLTITDIIPSTFTLRIAAVDAENGEPIVDANGKQFTATKKVVVDVKRDTDGKVITPYVTTINGVDNSGEAFFAKHNDGNGTDFNQLLFGTDANPILVDIDLTLDATEYKGKTIMFEERLYFGEFDTEGHEVLIENDFTKVEQQVTVPDLHTTAIDAETGEHTITVSGNATSDEWYLNASDLENYDWKIKDTVSMNKITPDTDYTLVTIVVNKDTGKAVTNLTDGSKFVQYTPYHSPAGVATGAAAEYKCECGKDGCVDVIAVDSELDIDLKLNKTDARNGGTFVVYEYMLLGTNNTYVPDESVAVPNDCYAYHNDITDEEQTIVIPELHTEFIESHTETHVVPLEEDATVIDTIHYKGLVPGKNYIMQCVLMNKTTGEPYYLTSTDDEGNTVLTKITEDKSFTASETGEGYVEISFTIPADQLHDFDEYLDKDHLNINRTVTDTGTAPEVDVDGNLVVEPTDVSGNDDTRVITNEYTGEEARAERGISDEEKINVTKSTQIVAFERCISDEENSRVYAVHADIEDEDQTILVPRIFTHLTDTVIGDHVSRWNTTETITDTVTFVSLQADKEYTIEGYLVNVDTGEPILVKDANGEDVRVTATKTFTPNTLPDTQVSISNGKLIASGNVDLVFTFDSTALKGTHVVAFEDCKYGEIKVATHAEIDDQWQWMFVPEIGTTANGYVKATDGNAEYREKVVPYSETAQLIDVVEYNKLLPGVWYEMSGTIMDKATGKAITDKDGKAVTATTRFLPAESSGKVEVIFTLDTTGLEGKTLVVFEECLYVGAKKDGTANKEAVAEHKDIEDEDQTIYCPKIRTTVKDANGNTNVQLDGTKTQTIIDTVTYENLIPGKEYTVTGTLVFKRDYGDSKDYEYVKDANGNKITASTTFKPDESNSTIKDGLASGTVEVKFEFNAALTAGRRVVVFEDLYLEKVRVGTHSDINDENQTFDTVMKLHVKLVKSDFDNHVYVLKNAEISIYVDEKCTQLAKDINGNDCVGKTNEKGEVEFIIITYDENQLFYAKETKAPFGYKLCEDVIPIKGTAYYDGATNTKTTFTDNDMSRESDGVCAINLKMFDKIIIIPPKTGDNLPILPITILALIGLLCVGAFFATKRKKVVTDVDDTTDNVEEMDEEAVEDAITGMMTEEIDGDGHNDSGF